MTFNSKVALIAGITGQNDAYFADFHLNKCCVVHGPMRRTSLFNTSCIAVDWF